MAVTAELENIVAQIGIAVKELTTDVAKHRKEAEERQKEAEERQKEAEERQKEAEERRKEIGQIMKDLAESQKEASAEMANSIKELKKTVAETSRTVQKTSENLGGINNSIGEIVEMILLPGVRLKINAFNHDFTAAAPRKRYFKKDNSLLTEVDLLLENSLEVMVIEVKTQFSKKWVEHHLKRLEILRKNEAITGMTGRTIYAAIAGMSFDADAVELAVETGMYLIKIIEDADNDKIEVTPPSNGVKSW